MPKIPLARQVKSHFLLTGKIYSKKMKPFSFIIVKK